MIPIFLMRSRATISHLGARNVFIGTALCNRGESLVILRVTGYFSLIELALQEDSARFLCHVAKSDVDV